MSGDLAFNINYPTVEISCAELGHPGAPCNAVHRQHTGEARLTVVGSIQRIQQIASEIIPGWPITPEAPTTCTACGAEIAPNGSPRCDDCVRNGWTPLEPPPAARRKALSATELDALPFEATVIAGALLGDRRVERVRWVKLHNGRWETARQERVDDACGVSSIWLANNRRPMCDDGQESV